MTVAVAGAVARTHPRSTPKRRGFVHGPHGHGDLPIGLHDLLPDRGQDDLAVGSGQIVMTLLHMGAKDIHLEEGLLDELFHALSKRLVSRHGSRREKSFAMT